MTTSPFLQRIRTGTVVFDGAMGTSIHQHDLDVEKDYCGCENCTDILSLSRPDIIQSIHEEFLAAGADCIETDSFGGGGHVLAEFDIQDKAFDLNKAAAEVARAAAAKFSTKDKPRFVIGSMGPGTKLITLGQIGWQAMFESYREQARGLLAGGVDAFIIETCQDLLQVKCVINAVLAALDEKGKSPEENPILASVTIESTGTMLLGTEIAAAATALAGFPIASLGLNCATGPVEMADHVKWLGKHWRGGDKSRPLSVMPNAGLPILHNGKTEYPLAPGPFVEAMVRFMEADGVNIVGGCCGTTPEHIRQLVDAVEQRRRKAHTAGPVVSMPDAGLPRAVTSLYSTQDYRQDNSIFIIGERMNASGSRAFKRLLEAEDWDGMVALAREQVRHDGAHALDINVDYAGRDNAQDMAEVVKRIVRQVNAPLMLDSTQMKTLEAGLAHAGGKCIINSANFEDGEEKFDLACRLARTYGAALVVGSIDEDKENSMARTRDRKLAIAQRAFDRATKVHGLAPHDLLFDPLVLPVSTGMENDRRSGLETIEGVRLISTHLPECQTTVGLSNVSFGLSAPARVVLNSVFLHELQAAGLTSAIVHFSKILPRNKIPDGQWHAALDVILDKRVQDGPDPLQVFIGLFKDASTVAVKKAVRDLTIEERLREHIIDGNKEGLDTTLKDALQKFSPLDIINDHLLDGMKTVGELFGSGQMQLPFVLQSAEVMKMAVARLEPLMERASGQAKGTIVLATVKGDVHDIGKNLVDIILTNNGYKVVNLGIKQPLGAMVEAWKSHKADAIGMSGLLVKSVTVMEENLREMNAAGISPRVLLGGAALTRHYCEGHLRGVYQGEVFYGRDAFEGLRTMDLIAAGDTGTLHGEVAERTGKRSAAEETINQTRIAKLAVANSEGAKPATAGTTRSAVAADVPVPAAPFLGTRVVKDIKLQDLFPYINKVALYRGQWQFKKGALSDDQFEAQVADEVDPIFLALCERCVREKILEPKVVYGYFACNSVGNDLVVYDPEFPRENREKIRFSFPRQPDKRRLCISDYFRPAGSGVSDVIGMSCVTIGGAASIATKKLFDAHQYTDYLYLHGLSVETAEALAEFWHKRMRQELGIANEDSPRIKELFTQKYRGSRYSFGYPACPDMSDQDKLFALLDPSRIGCVLTENWQIDPEQSTSAIVVHHPEAKYFNV